MGYVNEIFDEATLATLPGTVAIGHTRYSTAGESKLLERAADPDRLRARPGRHLPQRQHRQRERSPRAAGAAGSIFQTNSDTEVVLHLYARSQAGSVEDALVESITQLTGAFSFALITKDSLIAVRDPHGFRPLALGRLGDAWAVTSETCALDLIGATYVRDVEPGEVLIIGPHGLRSIKPFPNAPLSHCIFEHVYFARPDSDVFGQSVNEVAHQSRPRAGARDRRRRRRRRADSRLGRVRRDRLLRRVEDADAVRVDPQPLRRPHVHRAGAVDPPLRREGEAQYRSAASSRASAWC